MGSKRITVLCRAALAMLLFFLATLAAADEKIIKQEKISYEKCLKVIVTSEDKLSIAPEMGIPK